MRSRSNSATPAITVSISFAAGEVVSAHGSASDLKPITRSPRSLMIDSMSSVDRARRSSLVTTMSSPGRTNSSSVKASRLWRLDAGDRCLANDLAAGRLQHLTLNAEILIVARNARVSVFHSNPRRSVPKVLRILSAFRSKIQFTNARGTVQRPTAGVHPSGTRSAKKMSGRFEAATFPMLSSTCRAAWRFPYANLCPPGEAAHVSNTPIPPVGVFSCGDG